jgi:hypothetical protein
MSNGYIIQLGPGFWLRPKEGNPHSMTLRRESATVFPSLEEAREAFATAKLRKRFALAIYDEVGEDAAQPESGEQHNG